MARETVKRTGFSSTTAQSFIVNAGAVYMNLEYDETDGWTGERLGATSGGNSVTIENEFREIEIDGTFSRYVGEKVLIASNASLTANVKEITANVIKLAIIGSVRDSAGTEEPEEYDVVEGRGRVEPGDYLANIGLIGELSGSNQPVVIILDNALCTSGLELSTADDDEAVTAMTFEAHADANQVEDRTLPARIYMPQVPVGG